MSTLWYTKPAVEWEEALPLGNGRLGAMVSGNLRGERIQIDGNFGVTAAIAQMLVQSREHKIILLPALPKAWDHGEVKGLRLVGNAGIDLTWKNGKLAQCTITADQAYEGEVVYGELRCAVKLEKGETMVLDEALQEKEN